MNWYRTRCLGCLLVMIAGRALAQSVPVEPAVQTSSVATPSTPTGAATPAAAPAAPPASGSKSADRATANSAANKGSRQGKADRLQLDATQISGNRELPRVMYVVPYHKADPDDLAGRPLHSMIDEALSPVDREVFQRQNRYFAELRTANAAHTGAGAAGAPGPAGAAATAVGPSEAKPGSSQAATGPTGPTP